MNHNHCRIFRLSSPRHDSQRCTRRLPYRVPLALAHQSHLGFVDHGPIIDDLASDQPHPHAMVLIEIAKTEMAQAAFINRHQASLAHAPRLALDRRQQQEEASHEEHT